MTTTLYTCLDCEEEFDLDEGGDYSALREGWLCGPCVENDGQYASSAWHVTPDGDVTRYAITDSFVYVTEYGEEVGENSPLTRRYVATDGWRGYYETRPTGDWTPVVDGWTTGNWGDPVADSKQRFNRWAEALIAGDVTPPCEVWLVADPTSNVFSTAVTVFVPDSVDLDEADLTIPEL